MTNIWAAHLIHLWCRLETYDCVTHWITWHFNNRYKEHIVQPHFGCLGRKNTNALAKQAKTTKWTTIKTIKHSYCNKVTIQKLFNEKYLQDRICFIASFSTVCIPHSKVLVIHITHKVRYTQEINQHDLNSNCLLIEPDVEPMAVPDMKALINTQISRIIGLCMTPFPVMWNKRLFNLSTWHCHHVSLLNLRDSLHQVLTVSLLINSPSICQTGEWVCDCYASGLKKVTCRVTSLCALPNAYIVSMAWLHSVCLNSTASVRTLEVWLLYDNFG